MAKMMQAAVVKEFRKSLELSELEIPEIGAGQISGKARLAPLSPIHQILDRLEHGDVPSRVVLDFARVESEVSLLAATSINAGRSSVKRRFSLNLHCERFSQSQCAMTSQSVNLES